MSRKIKVEDAPAISRIQTSITKSSASIDFKQVIEKQVRAEENISLVAEVDGETLRLPNGGEIEVPPNASGYSWDVTSAAGEVELDWDSLPDGELKELARAQLEDAA